MKQPHLDTAVVFTKQYFIFVLLCFIIVPSMKFVPAKCPNCGGTLQVDPEKDAAVCEYCKAPFIVEKAINNYNTTIINNNNFAGATVNMIHQNEDVETLIKAAGIANESGEYARALEICDKILLLDPQNSIALTIKCFAFQSKNYDELLMKLKFGVQAIKYCDNQELLTIIKDRLIPFVRKTVELNLPFLSTIFFKEWYISAVFDILKEFQITDLYRTVTLCASFGMTFRFDERVKRSVFAGENTIYITASQPHDITVDYVFGSKSVADFNIKPGNNDLFMIYNDKQRHNCLRFTTKEEEKEFAANLQKQQAQPSGCYGNPTKGCYVATCVYNSYDCPEVWRLRRYRDNYLDNHWWGRLFIKLYYKVSPTLVKWFGKKNWFRKPIKSILDRKIIKLKKKGYDDTPYIDKY